MIAPPNESVAMVIVELLRVGVGVELANASDNQGNHCTSAEPPSDGNTCGETGYDEENKPDSIKDD